MINEVFIFFMRKNRLLTILFVIAAAYIGIYAFIVRPYIAPVSIFYTPAIRNPDRVSAGYTLIAPYNNALNADSKNKGAVYLTDMLGRPVHSWTTDRQVLSAQLLPNNHLLVAMEAPRYSEMYPGGGNTGVIQELDWSSRIIREIVRESAHHDVAVLQNGNIAFASWEKLPRSIAQEIRGGIPGTELKGDIWSDEIIELDPAGNTVWSWHAHEHLRPAIDIIDQSLSRSGWTYINGISHVPENPIDGEEAYLVSVRSINTVILIRKRDGEIIWRSPKGILNTQHDPSVLPNGAIMVFDNGFTRTPSPIPLYGSRVVVIDPKTNTVTWTFDGGPGVMDKLAFYGPLVGRAQQLPNGNVLITDGPRGHIFEVTPEKEIVWDIISPFTTKMSGAFPINFLFKARRYTEDEVAFPDTTAPAFNRVEHTIATSLTWLYPWR